MASDEPPEEVNDTRSLHFRALDRVSQITSISLCFAIPVVGGVYLDRLLNTKVLFTILLLLFGSAAAGLQLRSLIVSLDEESRREKRTVEEQTKD